MRRILSASAISCLKSCPFKYRNAYHLGLRPIEEAEPLRIGSNWHEGLELLSLNPEQPCPACSKLSKPDSSCYVCAGTGFVDDPLSAVVRMLNHKYEQLYPNMSRDTRETERVMVLYSLFAYKYHYDGKPVEVVAREIPFRIPLVDPRTHHAIPNVWIDGKIDKLVRHEGQVKIMEHKSTSDGVDPSSDYWGRLRLDTQTMLYVYAVQRLQVDGLLAPWIKENDEPVSSILYDVWHKPQIKPKKLSQAETTAFVADGVYFGQEFGIDIGARGQEDSGIVSIDGVEAEVETLKKGYTIRETPDMFGARLFDDVSQRSDYYFGRKPITRSERELERFEWELFNLYQTIEAMTDNDSWFHNEHSCDNHGRCDFMEFCYSGREINANNPPAGFKCIFEKKGKQ
jgi:hypothetical protein